MCRWTWMTRHRQPAADDVSSLHDPPAFLRMLFDAAVAAADPARLLPGRLPPPPDGRTVVLGAGKAAASMAAAVERELHGPLEGLVVTRYRHDVPCARVEVVEAAHPVPDAAGRAAAGRIPVSYTHLRAHETDSYLVCRLLLEKKKK